MKVTKEELKTWGIEIPMARAYARLGRLNRKNKDEWCDFLAGLIKHMKNEDYWKD